MTLKYIIEKTAQVAIGPLEYAGHAGVSKNTHGKKLYVIVFILQL